MSTIYHALVLNLHQPSGNLEALLQDQEWEVRQILSAYDRISRSLWEFADVARAHLAVSGTLLETLANPEFQNRVYGLVKCGDLLWHWQNQQIIHILGTAYYHPVLPLIPPADWEEQLTRWLGLARHLFWRPGFSGFWPPEMGFCQELIPLLKRLGYRYVVVDSEHIEPLEPMRWEEVRYRPHFAEYGGEAIVVVVRDRELSNAQESGMDHGWFMQEVHQRTQFCDFPPLVTTCSDGENGGWFRNPSFKANFWGAFYQPLLEWVRAGRTEVRPTFIDDYLNAHGARGRVRVRPGAWNTGWHSGLDFTQWTSSDGQRAALRHLADTSRAFHQARERVQHHIRENQKLESALTQAHWHLLRAETSCHFYWGDAWLSRCQQDLDETWKWLGEMARSEA